ncbi:hypothetical protein ABK040_009154 [Willaertia magna]
MNKQALTFFFSKNYLVHQHRSFHSSKFLLDISKRIKRKENVSYDDYDPDLKDKPKFSGKISSNYIPFDQRPGGVPEALRKRIKEQYKDEHPLFFVFKLMSIASLIIYGFYYIANKQLKETTMKEEVMRKTAVVFRRRIMELQITKGDLTDQEVDAIVNPANSLLQHNGGVAKAIADKAGSTFNKECQEIILKKGQVPTGEAVVTTNGGEDSKLLCKHVIHTVGPVWKGGKQGEQELLEKAIFSALREADDIGAKVVSLPGISSGIFGFPKRKCAEIIIDAVLKYAYERDIDYRASSIQIVKFVNIDDETTEAFNAAWDHKKVRGQLV